MKRKKGSARRCCRGSHKILTASLTLGSGRREEKGKRYFTGRIRV